MKSFTSTIFTVCLMLSAASTQSPTLLNFQGEVYLRQGLNNNWQPCEIGMRLAESDVLRTEKNSTGEIEITPGQAFHLPEQVILEGRELKAYATSELVKVLTVLEISNLPTQPRQLNRSSGAYVVHDNQKSVHIRELQTKQYIEMELNGLQALINQNFWSGALLKAIKLKKYKKLVDLEFLDFQVLLSYQKLGLNRRFEDARDKFMENYPGSQYREKL